MRVQARRQIQCPLCRGEGGFWDTIDRKPPLGIWEEPPEFFWDECPECEGRGTIREEVWEEPDLWESLFRTYQETETLSQWVRAYREARRLAHLPPDLARQAANAQTFGPQEVSPLGLQRKEGVWGSYAANPTEPVAPPWHSEAEGGGNP